MINQDYKSNSSNGKFKDHNSSHEIGKHRISITEVQVFTL